MAWDGLGAFVRALEERAELVRIRRRVDPHLEVSAIADRVMKAGGPALLFENVAGSSFPLLINAYGSKRRMALALGVDDLEEHARAIADLVHTKAPSSARDLAQLVLKLPERAHVPPRSVGHGSCQDVVQLGEAVDLAKLHGTVEVERALEACAHAGRFGDGDLAAILAHQQQAGGELIPFPVRSEDHSLQRSTKSWEGLGR